MLNETTIKGLRKARASLIKQRTKLDEDIEALDRILANNDGIETGVSHSRAMPERKAKNVTPGSTRIEKRRGSSRKGEVVRKVREMCQSLGEFSKDDVEAKMKMNLFTNIDEIQIRRALTRLLKRGEITVLIEGSGRRPSTYKWVGR